MKKLYFFLTLAASAMAASALEPLEATGMHIPDFVKTVQVPVAPAKIAPVKTAPVQADILGEYIIKYYDLTMITQSMYSNETTITAGSKDGEVVLSIPFLNQGVPYSMDVKGTYTPEDGRITFTSGQVAFGADITYYLYDEQTDKENVINTIYCEWNGNGFSFNPNFTIGLPAGGNSFYFKGGYFSLERPEPDESDPMEGWTTVGEGKMQDGWIMPGVTDVNQADYIYNVEIQSKDGEKDVYRVVDPYRGQFPLASINQSTAAHGFIEFNVADPEHVYFYGSEAGFANSELGISKFYPNNAMGYLLGAVTGATPEMVIGAFGSDPSMMWSTFKNGVVIVPAIETEDAGYMADANFGIQGAQFGGYGWQTKDKLTKNMEAKIFMPGVSGVDNVQTIDHSPVEYYNLQGLRVEKPFRGVFIRVQGNHAVKVRF